MSRSDFEDFATKLGCHLKKPTTLVVIGFSVVIMMGCPDRITMDVDVWSKRSQIDLDDLRQACAACGVLFNPKGRVSK